MEFLRKLMRKVMGGRGRVPQQPRWSQTGADPGHQVREGTTRGVKGYGKDDIARGSGPVEDFEPRRKLGAGAWEIAGLGDQHQASQLWCPPHTWGAGERRGATKGARPLLGRGANGPAPDPESPSARKAAPSAGLAASPHSGLRSRSLAPDR